MKFFEITGFACLILGTIIFATTTNINGLASFDFLGFIGLGCFFFQRHLDKKILVKKIV